MVRLGIPGVIYGGLSGELQKFLNYAGLLLKTYRVLNVSVDENNTIWERTNICSSESIYVVRRAEAWRIWWNITLGS